MLSGGNDADGLGSCGLCLCSSLPFKHRLRNGDGSDSFRCYGAIRRYPCAAKYCAWEGMMIAEKKKN